jgi:hypothetical protein
MMDKQITKRDARYQFDRRWDAFGATNRHGCGAISPDF